MHMEPSVAHVGPAGRGPHLRAGMALAIEPMITLGSPEVTVLADDWTVATIDGSVAAHWEHSVALTESGPVVLTAQDGGVTGSGRRGVSRSVQSIDSASDIDTGATLGEARPGECRVESGRRRGAFG